MWAIVPVKTFDKAKQRLANVLSEEERRALMLAMARDVLTCLSTTSGLTGILIVSRAPEADALAQTFGTERFAESPEANLPEALEQATQHLMTHFDAKGVMVVPADVPGIEANELTAILQDHQEITLLPDAEHIGTNGLICSPPLRMPYIFDGKSFKPHVDGAFAVGVTPKVVPNTRFTLDVDTPDDLMAVLDHAPDSQTSNYLNKSGIAARVKSHLQDSLNSHSG